MTTTTTDATCFLYTVTKPITGQVPRLMGAHETLPIGAVLECDESPDELTDIHFERDYDGESRRAIIWAICLRPDGNRLGIVVDVEEFRARTRAGGAA